MTSEKETAELKTCRDKRSHQQGIVKGLLNKIEEITKGSNKEMIPLCKDFVKKVKPAVDAYKTIHASTVATFEKYGQTIEEIEKKKKELERCVEQVLSDAGIWVTYIESQQKTSQLERFGELGSSPITSGHFPSTMREPYTTVSGAYSRDDDKESEIDELRTRLRDMEAKVRENESLKSEVCHIRDTMEQQRRDFDEDEQQYKQSLGQLQEQIRVHEGRQRGSEPNETTAEASGAGNTSISVQDMLTLSTVMGQSNSAMFRQILEETQSQNTKFYSQVAGPKVEMGIFDGDRTKYTAFINRFEDLVGSTDRSFASKLTTLIEHCGKTVKPYLESCNYMTARNGYMSAINILQERYGNPYLISQAWLQKLSEFGKLRSADQMTQFMAVLSSASASLKSMGYESELANTRSMKEIFDRLPSFVQNKWLSISREKTQKGMNASLSDMLSLIGNVTIEMNDPVYCVGTTKTQDVKGKPEREKEKFKTNKKSYAASKDERKSTAAYGETRKEGDRNKSSKELPPCVMCGKNHATYRCFLYKDLSANERLEFVEKENLCTGCISAGHVVADCTREWKCLIQDCGRKHHYSLHRALEKREGAGGGTRKQTKTVTRKHDDSDEDTDETDIDDGEKIVRRPVKLGTISVKPCYMGYGVRLFPDYILPVIPVYLYNRTGGLYGTYALIDSGSSCTMIKKSLYDMLNVPIIATADVTLSGLNSDFATTVDVVDVCIRGTKYSEKHEMENVIVNDQLEFGTRQPKEIKRYGQWDHLKHLDLVHHDHDEIGVLIGQDQAFLIVQQEKIEGPNRYFPIEVRTRLGWTMFGHFADKIESLQKLGSVTVEKTVVEADTSLENTLEKMWEMDKVPDSAGHGPINRHILKMWDKKSRLMDGHIEVPIPFKEDPPKIPSNFKPVKAKLDVLTRRLLNNDELKDQYVKAMVQNIELGFLEKAPLSPDVDYLHYNPHLPVLSETRSTKCRVVGHLSYKHNDISLNDTVHQGPNLNTHLVEVMIGFRVYRYVITGDIEKMFNQVRVPPYQRDSLSILWYKDNKPGAEIETLRGCTQMFGGNWSPSASVYALQKSTDLFGHEYPSIVTKTVKKGFYVDDLLRSITTISIGLKLIFDLRELLGRVGFNLIKFGSNSLEIIEALPVELRGKAYQEIEFTLSTEVEDKTLGSWWKPAEDVFGFKITSQDKPLTRRGLLSTFSSIFDPLGFVGPVVLVAKLLIQELCRKGLAWDELIPEEYVQRWICWRDQLPELESYTVERWLGVDPEEHVDYQLHVFADASEVGYGCVIYLCSIDDDGQVIKSSLVISKTKVAPLKAATIPRLELTAAVLAARMENKMVEYLDISLLPSVFWVDSMVVLHYIKQQSREYKTYVANRISVIQDLTEAEQWRYVPSAMNIADVASRGMSPAEFVKCVEWREGPRFLKSISDWPKMPEHAAFNVDYEKRERKMMETFVVLQSDLVKVEDAGLYKFVKCFSQWNKKVRVLVLLRRLVQKSAGRKVQSGPITVEEYQFCEEVIVKLAQKYEISDVKRKTRYFQKLYPFDKDGLMRVGGRLMLSNLRFEEKHPIIFPRSELAASYVRHVHARIGHPGVDRTLYEVRKRYWLVGGRKYIKEILNGCVTCRKLKGRPMQQFMSSLPKDRVTEGKAPFEHVGIDYFGPVYVKIGRSMHKRWGCVITCFKTRASHIEMASDMSASCFINVLQRFIARRGKPDSITSDNGTNFVGANAELKKVFAEWNEGKVHGYLVQQGIEWKFNPPGASHHGGVWERQIRTIRQLMMSIIKEQVLSDEGLNTYMCLIEEIVNSRPLTKLSEEIDDDLPLTPNHLLMLRQTQGLIGNYEKGDTLRRRWKQLQFMADMFWKRWVQSYIKTLQERSKWTKRSRNVEVGDLVLMVNENLPRLQWPLAVVTRVFMGKDDVVRSVQVRSQDGSYERPISKLVSLECDA